MMASNWAGQRDDFVAVAKAYLTAVCWAASLVALTAAWKVYYLVALTALQRAASSADCLVD